MLLRKHSNFFVALQLLLVLCGRLIDGHTGKSSKEKSTPSLSISSSSSTSIDETEISPVPNAATDLDSLGRNEMKTLLKKKKSHNVEEELEEHHNYQSKHRKSKRKGCCCHKRTEKPLQEFYIRDIVQPPSQPPPTPPREVKPHNNIIVLPPSGNCCNNECNDCNYGCNQCDQCDQRCDYGGMGGGYEMEGMDWEPLPYYPEQQEHFEQLVDQVTDAQKVRMRNGGAAKYALNPDQKLERTSAAVKRMRNGGGLAEYTLNIDRKLKHVSAAVKGDPQRAHEFKRSWKLANGKLVEKQPRPTPIQEATLNLNADRKVKKHAEQEKQYYPSLLDSTPSLSSTYSYSKGSLTALSDGDSYYNRSSKRGGSHRSRRSSRRRSRCHRSRARSSSRSRKRESRSKRHRDSHRSKNRTV